MDNLISNYNNSYTVCLKTHLDVCEGAVVGLDQGPRQALVLDLIDEADEAVYHAVVNVPPVVPVQQHLEQ